MGVPRTTHQWLKNLYNYLDGKSQSPTGLAVTQFGSSTGIVGFYGQTGAKQIATGGIGLMSATNLGVSGIAATGLGLSGLFYDLANAGWNGGTGTVYSVNDVVVALKNIGILKP